MITLRPASGPMQDYSPRPSYCSCPSVVSSPISLFPDMGREAAAKAPSGQCTFPCETSSSATPFLLLGTCSPWMVTSWSAGFCNTNSS